MSKRTILNRERRRLKVAFKGSASALELSCVQVVCKLLGKLLSVD